MSSSVVVPFLASLQASVAVLLTIFTGVIAVQFNLISEGASKELSKVCTKLFLPALLITNVGSQLHADAIHRYIPILVFSIAYNAISLALGTALTKAFRMPAWTTPAIAFNNTTALPLLLLEALSTTGILDTIDQSGDPVARAKSYFLVNATIGNCLTFTLGPKLLNPHDDEPGSNEPKTEDERDAQIESQEQSAEHDNEETSLLPNRVARAEARTWYSIVKTGSHALHRLPRWLQHLLTPIPQLINPPVVGATIGILIGLVPALHRLFFNSEESGGYLNAWLTTALSNVGSLFVSLQVVVIGVKLSVAVLRFRKGESSGRVPWRAFVSIILMRFVVWPAVSISVVYALASRTALLSDDRILWFAMMLMPTGPSALNLTALADVGGSDEEEKLGIAKVLTASYVLSPLICFSVVGSLKACQAVGAS